MCEELHRFVAGEVLVCACIDWIAFHLLVEMFVEVAKLDEHLENMKKMFEQRFSNNAEHCPT